MGKKDPIRRVLRAVLKPVIGFCLRRSFRMQELQELCKQVFVELAAESLKKEGSEVSMSRISVITGVHRKDIARFLGRSPEYQPKDVPDLYSRVLGQWQNDKRFCTPKGRARTLSYEGPENEFKELVASVSREIKSHTVLFALERAGAVKKTSRGLKLVNKSYISVENLEEGLYFLETDLSDLVLCVEENLLETKEAPNLHLKTEYTRIPKSKIPEVRNWLLDTGSTFHQRVRTYLSKLDADINLACQEEEFERVSVAMFSITEEMEKAS